MDKRILIPTDFSENALNATIYALELYKRRKCEFYLLNVFHPENYTTRNLLVPEPGSPAYEKARARSEAGFANLLDVLELQHRNPGHTYRTITSNNFLGDAIKQAISDRDIELVVMGTKGATGAKGVIMGSNTVNAMEYIRECPVLAIPEKIRFTALKEIVFPTNYKSTYKRKALGYLVEISKIHGAAIRVLYIARDTALNDTQNANRELLADILESTDHSFHTLPGKDVSEMLTSFIESRGSDMIAFVNRKHFFFGSVFARPLVKEMGYEANLPILALH